MRFFLFSYNSIVVRIIQFKIFEYRQNIFNQIKSNISNSLPNFLHSWRMRTREWFDSHSFWFKSIFDWQKFRYPRIREKFVRNPCKNTKHRIQEINYASSRTRTFTVLLRGKLIPNEISPISSYSHQYIRTYP